MFCNMYLQLYAEFMSKLFFHAYWTSIVELLLSVLIINSVALGVRAATLPDLLIVQIQTASKQSATQELIRIANTTTQTIDLAGVRLEYFSANPKSITIPSRTIKLTGKISANQTYLVSSKDYLVDKSDLFYSATLAGAGGHLRLSSGPVTNPNIFDFVGWGTAKHPRGGAATAPAAGEILNRKKDSTGRYLFSGNNIKDFQVGDGNPKAVASPSKPTSIQPKTTKPITIAVTKSENYSGLVISELMPNPKKPLLDSKDEYVELYNSSNRTIRLAGLKLLSGQKLNHSYSFKSGTIGPGKYKAIYVTESKLTLTNSGGKVELHTSDGKKLGLTISYDKAKDGLSYSWNGSIWQWTDTPTPGLANVFSGDGISKENSSPKESESGSSSSRNGQVKGESTEKGKDEENATRPVNSSIIAGVGGLGLIYGVYEYRTDIGNLFNRIRGNRSSRRKDR